MKIITWDKDDIKGNVDFIDDFRTATDLVNALHIDTFDTDIIKTEHAIAVCKMKLMGEYHGILVKEDAEMLVDAEVYLLTWDGEASDGGEMIRIEPIMLRKVARGTLFTGDVN